MKKGITVDNIIERAKNWYNCKGDFDKTKTLENELRKEICDYVLAGKTKGAKSQKVKDENETFKLTATGILNSKIDVDELKNLWPELSKEERACIRFKPELIQAGYSKLPEDSMLKRVVTLTPGMASLKLDVVPLKK